MNRSARLFFTVIVALLATAVAPAGAFATYGKIKVVKDLIPSTDSGRFNLKIDTSTVKSNAGDGDWGSNDRLSAHSTHSVSETGSSLSDYDSSIKCTKNGSIVKSGSGTSLSGIPVYVGDYIICTITNTRKGTIEIEKQTDPDGSNASFGFTSSLAGNLNFDLSDGGVRTITNVTPNQGGSPYFVTESAKTGWRLQSVSCSDPSSDSSGSFDNRKASIKVSPGETVRCTFTNKEFISEINVVKTGPAFVNHGGSITYRFAVTTPGRSPLHSVTVVDDRCDDVSPTPVEFSGGDDDDVLEDGETWVFVCTMTVGDHVPGGEEDPIHNIATATGIDEWDRTVVDYDDHYVDIVHPPALLPPPPPPAVTPPAATPPGVIQVLGQQALSGRATLAGQTGCASRAFTATVRGRQISRVTFYVDGRRVRQVNARSGRTRFTARVSPAGRRIGVHRVTARVVFAPASGTRARTLVLAFQRCGRAARPVFTG